MNKLRILNIISVISFIELIACVAYPAYVMNTQNLELGALVLGFVFGALIIYYIIFILFISRYSKKEETEQNIGWVIFLDIAPLIFYAIIYAIS